MFSSLSKAAFSRKLRIPDNITRLIVSGCVGQYVYSNLSNLDTNHRKILFVTCCTVTAWHIPYTALGAMLCDEFSKMTNYDQKLKQKANLHFKAHSEDKEYKETHITHRFFVPEN